VTADIRAVVRVELRMGGILGPDLLRDFLTCRWPLGTILRTPTARKSQEKARRYTDPCFEGPIAHPAHGIVDAAEPQRPNETRQRLASMLTRGARPELRQALFA